MNAISIINKSQFEGTDRIDAEYYKPEYLVLDAFIKNNEFNFKSLEDISLLITNGHTPLHADLTQGEVNFLTAENIEDFHINNNRTKKITKKASLFELKRTIVKEKDLLITIKGKIGNAAVVNELTTDTNINQDVARIVLKKNIDPFYVSVFLNSKYGKLQSKRISTDQINPFLGLGNLKKILISIINLKEQKYFTNQALLALDEMRNSKLLYSQAEELLLRELGLEDEKFEDELSYVVNYSDIKKVQRMDADYFQPKYKRLLSIIGEEKYIKLSKLARRTKQKVEIVKNTEYQYIEIGCVDIGSAEINPRKIFGRNLPANAILKIVGGELLVSKVRPTRGAISIVPEDWKSKYIASNAFAVFKIDIIAREYVQVILKSIIGKLQLERPTTGTSYPTVTDKDVENVRIPILPQRTQERIANLVRQAHATRKKSKELLKEAILKVEQMIEKGAK